MHPGTLRALEFDQIVEILRGLALTPLGDVRLAALVPEVEVRPVESALATTTEMVRFLTDHPGLPLRAPDDIDDTLSALAVEGRPLEPLRLAGLVSFLESIDQTAHAIRRTARGSFELLRGLIAPLASFEREIAEVRRAIDPSGELFDHASPELRSIRDRLRRQRSRLRATLESYLRGKDTARYLQDQVITDRNGRYVLVVRAEHRGSIPGIVHGSSSSGASLYLEPLSTVDINNEVVALTEQEREEVLRILLVLTDAFRVRALDLQRGLGVAADLDVAQARARFSKLVDGVPPTLSTDGALVLRAARHPLLLPAIDARLRERVDDDDSKEGRPRRTDEPVPVDILITPPTSALVITGPNTGGKTVAIKTAGLAALMAQSGLHIPAAPGSRLPVFRTVFADIGDEQSIAANLSTFSWHVTNIAAMDRSLALPSLVLLDEVGAGTDPLEGGALGMAVIEHFRQRGALVLASTHYDTLKTYASTTPGVESAAFGFTPDTFAPTYRLVYGSPGRSLALEIAARLGLAASIVDAARAARTAREAQLADHLARVDDEVHALEHERRLVARERETIAADMTRFRQREEGLRQREEEFKRRLDARLDERMRDARREIDAVVEDLKRRAAALDTQASRRVIAGQPALTTGEAGAARSDARTAIDRLESRLRAEVTGSDDPTPIAMPADDRIPVPGDRVKVGGLGLEGIVQWVQEREAEIDVRGKRLRASLEDVRLLGGPVAPAARVSVSVQAVSREAATDLNVVGCTVDEALARADKFLDEALLGEQRTVRLIHGHGTGQLRRRIADFLHDHPLVARYAAAPPDQGGSGVTVVELKD